MEKAEEVSGDVIVISRPTEATRKIVHVEGQALKKYFEDAGIKLSPSEEVFCEGEKVNLDDKPEVNDYIQIVGKKEGGR